MGQSSSNINPRIVSSDKTDFYNPVLKHLNNIEFQESLLNTQDIEVLAQEITSNPRFNSSYRRQLVDCIKAQYQASSIALDAESPVSKNIEKLLNPQTLTVTTGQQIHIFLGPFFVVNKILSCCAEANHYDSLLPNNDIIPIFWMATEDHDFDEIKSTRLYNEVYEWDITSGGPVGRLNPKSLLPIVEKARERIDQTEENLQFLNICREAYSTCDTFADATRFIIHYYFESAGLVVIDPDDTFLKSSSTELFSSDIFDNNLSPEIDKDIETLKSYGVKVPINTRPINMFYITDDERNRLELSKENTYQLVDTTQTFNQAELKQKIISSPKSFSPNALLRPLYQQAILPNLHYVCGASEIVYWLELKSAMHVSNLVYPKLSVRKSLFFISQKNLQKLDTYEIPVEDLFIEIDQLREKIIAKSNIEINAINTQIDAIENKISEVLAAIKATDLGNTKKSEKTSNQLITALRGQVNSIIEKKSEHNVTLNQVTKLKENIFSKNYNQERNKYIISMVNQLHLAKALFHQDNTYFLNHESIVIIPN